MFRHFLDFEIYPYSIEITEPVGFDANSFKVVQDSERFGRDVTIGSEEIPLRFEKAVGEYSDTGTIMPDGSTIPYLTMGYEWLDSIENDKGFETSVKYRVQKNNVDFSLGLFDFANRKKVDGKYYEFKIVQETERAKMKRFAETTIDVLSSKDLDGNTITPVQTSNILLKAKSVSRSSLWEKNQQTTHDSLLGYSNFAVGIKSYGIDDTLTPFDNYPNVSGIVDAVNNFKYLRAIDDLTNEQLEVNVDAVFNYRTNNQGDEDEYCVYSLNACVFQEPYTLGSAQIITIYSKILQGTGAQTFVPPSTILYDLPDIPSGYCLSVWWNQNHVYPAPLGDSNHRPFITFNSLSQKISASSTAINSVIKGARWIDLIKQNVKSISGKSVIAPKFDVGGAFYNNFAFNGWLIRQFTDKPFNTTFKDLAKGLSELAADYQILSSGDVYIGQYADFYANKEISVFDELPDDEAETYYNERYQLVNFNYKYSIHEQDRDEQNTTDSVHTETQYLPPNKLVENKKDIEVPHYRDPATIESNRRQGIDTKATTSLQSDDKIAMLDVIEVAPASVGTFARKLLMRVINGTIQILNNDSEGNYTPFNWGLLGFKVGNTFKILSGHNSGSYTVTSIESTVLTLTPQSGTNPNFTGNGFITVEFPLSDVQFTNRTNQDFTLIENIDNSKNFSNLLYTIRRNIEHWGAYLATSAIYHKSAEIKNTYFKNNGLLKTQFQGGRIYTENENILSSSLAAPVITPIILKTKVKAPFEQVVSFLTSLETVNADGSIGGFCRVLGRQGDVFKGYAKMIDYSILSEELTLELEQRYEPEKTTIDRIGLDVVINNVSYSYTFSNFSWFEMFNDKVVFYDQNKKKISNAIFYQDVIVQGASYTDVNSFVSALKNL